MDFSTILVFCIYTTVFSLQVCPSSQPHTSALYYSDLPEHYTIGISPKYVNVGQSVLYTALGCQSSNSNSRSSSTHKSKYQSLIQLGSLLLLSCGDIHPCPGPNRPKYKFPCGDCQKPVKSNQKGIQCDVCDLWYHTKCLKMCDTEYFRFANDVTIPWECSDCECPYKFTDSFFNLTLNSTVSTASESEESFSELNLVSDFIQLRKKHKRNFIVSHININSLQYKFDELSIILRHKLVDCLFVSETKFNESHMSDKYKVTDYTLYRKDNLSDRGGGLVCYIRSDIPSYCVKPDCKPMEGLQINCVLDKEKWSLLCLYKKPNIPPRVINEKLDVIIDSSLNMCDKYVILGDLNCDMLKDKNNTNAVSQLCSDFNLTNIVKQATCSKGETPSLIDVILVSDKHSCKTGAVTPCALSDFHSFVHGVFKTNNPRTTSKRLFYRSFKHFDPVKFGQDLREAPFHVGEIFDIDSHMDYFQQMFLNILDRHAPIKTKTIRTSQCPHMNAKWKQAIYQRNMAHNVYLNDRSSKNFETYRKLRNKCSNLSKQALRNYFAKNCSTETKKEKPKHFWKIIKPYFSKKSKDSDHIQLEINNRIVSDPDQVAEHFNEYFLSVANKIGQNSQYANNVDQHPSFRVIADHVAELDIQTFDFKPIDEKSVTDIISRLPSGKAPGYDNISGHCVKAASSAMTTPIQCLINRMFAESLFPDPLKHADITPIYKKNNKLLAPNFRPVSVLICLSKVFELAMSDQLEPQLSLLYSIFISAYRKQIGCNSTLTYLLETWKEALDNDKYVGIVMMDLSKAFDCLPQDLLIKKLEKYNFGGGACALMHSYLTNRTQRVKIGSNYSSRGILAKGVPQGSILGPKIFNCFINDLLITLSRYCTPGNYADDNTVCVMHANKNQMLSNLKIACQIAI